jgi:hypothetical protein
MKILKWLLLAVLLITYTVWRGKEPLVLNALPPVSDNVADYEDFNFTRAFFNQYSSLLNIDVDIFYNSGLTAGQKSIYTANALQYQATSGSSPISYSGFSAPTVSSSSSSGTLDSTWRDYFRDVLFGRNFDSSTKKALQYPLISFKKDSIVGTTTDTFLALNIKSKIKFNIYPKEMLLAFSCDNNATATNYCNFIIEFYEDDTRLGAIDSQNYLNDQALNTRKYEFPAVFNNVNNFIIQLYVGNPTGVGAQNIKISEFNLFAETPIAVPDNAEDSVFGISFVAVEWWDVLGHFNNFLWWIVAQSPISPFFIWINDFVVAWVERIFTIFEEVFNL